MRDTLVASVRGGKRDRSPLSSPEKKTKKKKEEKKKEEKKKTFAEVSQGTTNVTNKATSTAPKTTTATTKKKKKIEDKKKEEKKKTIKERSLNVVVKLDQRQTYAGVLGKIRKESNPETCNSVVLGAIPTRKGDVLIRLGKGSDEKAFSTELKKDLRRTGNGARKQGEENDGDQRLRLPYNGGRGL